jgi:predicted phage terminase large subunit-like protein
MSLLVSGKLLVQDCKKGRWSTDEREDIIRETAEADGPEVEIYHEQEPGSGGKDSALATVKNLLGFSNHPDRPVGDKIYRADPYSVQVNHGNVLLLRGDWNYEFIEEHRNFPLGVKDQVDAASGACAKLAQKKLAGPVLPNKTR